jgi:hypothetical protein
MIALITIRDESKICLGQGSFDVPEALTFTQRTEPPETTPAKGIVRPSIPTHRDEVVVEVSQTDGSSDQSTVESELRFRHRQIPVMGVDDIEVGGALSNELCGADLEARQQKRLKPGSTAWIRVGDREVLDLCTLLAEVLGKLHLRASAAKSAVPRDMQHHQHPQSRHSP